MKTAPLLWPGGKSKIVHALKPHFGEVSCLVEAIIVTGKQIGRAHV